MFEIPVPEYFSFAHCLSFLKRSPLEPLHRCTKDGVQKVIRCGDRRVLFEVRAPEIGILTVRILNGRELASLRRELTLYVREWFDLDRDLTSFIKLARKDRILKPLIQKYYGYRIVGVRDLFECLIWAVIGQQINLVFAYQVKRRFVEAFGEALEHKGERYYLFPEPATVAKLQPRQLRRIQFSRQKIEYTGNIARVFLDGTLSKTKLAELSFEEAKIELTRIKGVGNWTANYTLMRSLRCPDAFPREDAGIHNALRKQLQLDRKPTLAEVDEVFERYRGHQAYASLYLWMSL